MEKGTENIIDEKGNVIAIIVYNDFQKQGANFFTPPDFSQQLGLISRSKGEVISAHTHNPQKRDIYFTQETIFIRKGKVKANFYNSDRKYLESRIVGQGDVILLASGGHGFEFLENADIIEVKQGPYQNDNDKSRFQG